MAVKKRKKTKLVLLMFWLGGLLLSWATAFIPRQVEDYYAQGFSKLLAGYLSLITGMVPFSLAEIIICVLGIGLIIGLIREVLRKLESFIKKRPGKKGALFSNLYKLAVFLGIIYFCFILFWGLNYNRLSFDVVTY